jgi:hypothetical protein
MGELPAQFGARIKIVNRVIRPCVEAPIFDVVGHLEQLFRVETDPADIVLQPVFAPAVFHRMAEPRHAILDEQRRPVVGHPFVIPLRIRRRLGRITHQEMVVLVQDDRP